MTHILMIDDDRRLCDVISVYLQRRNFETSTANDGAAGLQALAAGAFDLVVLDLMLPDMDGFEVCRRIRARSGVPILMLTARGDEEDRIVGLELGADDYVPKPFNPRELVARINAILRRGVAGQPGSVLRIGDLELDRAARRVVLAGQRRPLTMQQFDILWALAENAGRVLSREELMECVTGDSRASLDRSIDVHISRIRALLEEDAGDPRWILTVRGLGYLLPHAEGERARA